MAVRRNTNPFEDENEDFHDLSNDPELNSIKQQKDYHRQQMVASSNRSVQMIIESQSTAIETAEELRKQREQLERTNKNLDKINNDLDQSERNITSLKSVWGTIGNWFKKPIAKTEVVHNDNQNPDPDAFLKTQNQEIKNNLRKLNDTDLRFEGRGSASAASSSGHNTRPQTTEDQVVDNNLDALLAGLTVLKGQGLLLGNEIDEQNVLLEDIHKKTENMDNRVDKQNKNIQKILR